MIKGSRITLWQMNKTLQVKAQRVNRLEMHYNSQFEFLLSIEGSVALGIGEDTHILNEGEPMFINAGQIYTTNKNDGENLLLIVQLDKSYLAGSQVDLDYLSTEVLTNGFINVDEKLSNKLRVILSNLVITLNNEEDGYKFKVGSYIYLIGETLLRELDFSQGSLEKNKGDLNIKRLQRIIYFVNNNYHKSITLKEIAEKENLNYFYLSHFIKTNLGVSFQDYLNKVRLDRAIQLIVETNESIINISNNSGFSSISSFNNIFKDTFEMTPTQYRRKFKINKQMEKQSNQDIIDKYSKATLAKLNTYINAEVNVDKNNHRKHISALNIDAMSKGEKFEKHWQNLIAIGCAKEGLKKSWQDHLEIVQSEIGFTYTRFHGLFSEDMQVFTINQDGEIYYNWFYVNNLLDVLIKNNTRPYIELSFIPNNLDKITGKGPWWENKISYSQRVELWNTMVVAFINHSIKRYGIDEVNTWIFEIWKEPNNSGALNDERFKFYKDSINLIKSVSSDIEVGGPSVAFIHISSESWFIDYLDYLKKEEVPIDFISVYLFSQKIRPEKSYQCFDIGQGRIRINERYSNNKAYYNKNSHLKNAVTMLREANKDLFAGDLKVVVPSWGLSPFPNNLISDTAAMATFIIKNMLETIGLINSIGYWSLTDLNEVFSMSHSHFHGGFGLLNRDGIRKPSYNAYLLLAKLGSEIIDQSDNYIITKDKDSLQLLFFNHGYFKDEVIVGEGVELTSDARYTIYQDKNDLNIHYTIDNLDGKYKISKFTLNRSIGSAFDEWVNIGMPENMSVEEIKYLKSKDKPKEVRSYKVIKGSYSEIVTIPTFGVEMIILKKCT